MVDVYSISDVNFCHGLCFSGTTLIHGENFPTWMKRRRKKLNGSKMYYLHLISCKIFRHDE